MRLPFLPLLVCGLLLPTIAHADAPIALSTAETQEIQSPKCKAFVDAATTAFKNVKPVAGQDPVATALASITKPSTVSQEDWDRCASLFSRDVQTAAIKKIVGEGTSTLETLATGMKTAYASKKKLCPSTKQPVPPDLNLIATAAWASTPADWADPVWKCVGGAPTIPNQRFQYEIKTDAKAKTFELIARGYPAGDGQMVTLSRSGKVVGGQVVVGGVQAK